MTTGEMLCDKEIHLRRAKARTILETEPLRTRLSPTMLQNVKNWALPGTEAKKPTKKSVKGVCHCLGITTSDYLSVDRARFCEALSKACEGEVPATEILDTFNSFQKGYDKYNEENHSRNGFYKSAVIPLQWVNNAHIERLFSAWRGKYHLFHFSPSNDKKGVVTRAVLEICGTEMVGNNKYLCVSVTWAGDTSPRNYEGVIQMGYNQWYFVLGSASGHETACLVTFDPSRVGSPNKLYGVLVGCADLHPHYPTALKVFITKVEDDDELPPADLSEGSEIAQEILEAITIENSQSVLRAHKPE